MSHLHNSNHESETNRSVSRREALKNLAAITGAVSLAILPHRWEKPIIEVGVLPVHAQGSPVSQPTAIPITVAISNLSKNFTGLNDCTTPAGTGSSNNLSFDYTDPSNRVTSGSVIRFGSNFDTDVPSSIGINDSLISVSGNASSGTIILSPICTRFGSENSITNEVQLVNADGIESNKLQITVPKPPGAQDTGDGGPAEKRG